MKAFCFLVDLDHLLFDESYFLEAFEARLRLFFCTTTDQDELDEELESESVTGTNCVMAARILVWRVAGIL